MTALPPPEDLMACTECDALYRAINPPPGREAVCPRCHTILARPRRKAGMQIIALAVAILVLIVSAAFFPFLRVEASGIGHSTSVIGTVMAFSGERLVILAVAMAALVLLIPMLRMLLLLYVLVPVVRDLPPARHARGAFRLSERLRPWSMAEIFAIGCAVALVKVADLAQVELGPAFWMFAALVVIGLWQERFVCSWSVWNSLDPKNQS